MNEMMKRVAGAILENISVEESDIFGASLGGVEEAARAAILAMREPTEGMVEAPPLYFGPGCDLNHRNAVTVVWKSMIDDALADNESGESGENVE